MSLVYALGEQMTHVDIDLMADYDHPLIGVLSKEEFDQYSGIDESIRSQMAALLESESCYADILPDCIIGSMAVPDKEDLLGDRDLFSFYCSKDRLVFVDEGNICKTVVEKLAESYLYQDCSTFSFLYAFWNLLIDGDATWLGDLEDRMEDLEEGMLKEKVEENDAANSITTYRRAAIRFTAYYQQLAAMALNISGNEWNLLSENEVNDFLIIVNSADRLASRAETIREYSLQLRELYQTQLDMRQNSTMQILTIVTVLIAPLTLIAGWFGMNFTDMPGVGESWGFPTISVLGVLITILLLIWFRKKRWL